MRYGIPYKGSKNKIAKNIIAQLPSAKHFYDLFGGGGAMTHCALLSGKYKYVHYNEFNPLVFKAFKMAINGEFEGETRWISKEDFERLKDTDPYVACCYSFGNDFKTYAYGKKCELFKKAVHYSIFFNDNSLLKEYIDLSNFNYCSENLKERRLELQRFLTVLLRENKLERKVYGYFNHVGNARNVIQNLERLERLQSLESINNGGRVLLSNLSYEQVPIENDSVIYCDPPYKDTNTYLDDFNHEKFYDWARKQNNIFISEYTMPDDFKVLYQKEKVCSLGLNNNTKTIEKLFVNMGYESVYTQMNLF